MIAFTWRSVGFTIAFAIIVTAFAWFTWLTRFFRFAWLASLTLVWRCCISGCLAFVAVTAALLSTRLRACWCCAVFFTVFTVASTASTTIAAVVAVTVVAIATVAAFAAFTLACRLFFDHWCRCRSSFAAAEQGIQEALEQAGLWCCRCGNGGNRFRCLFNDRCRLIRRNALDHGFLARLDFFLLAFAVADVGFGLLGHGIAGLVVFEARVVVLDALEFVVRCFQMLVRNQDAGYAVTRFDLQDLATLFVQQEGRNIDRHLDVDGGRVFLHCLFLDNAQDLQRGRFGIADMAGAVAARAGHVAAFGQ